MALYNIWCSKCNVDFKSKISSSICPNCESAKNTKVLGQNSPAIHGGEFSVFEKQGKGYWEGLGEPNDPDAYIESEEQLRRVCEKKGVTSVYLENKEKHSKKAKE